jgi:GTPase SAR1 family protein
MRLKVVLLGEGRVGKTSILFRYIRNEFQEKQQSTLQASYMDKTVEVGGTKASLSVWDTAGQERWDWEEEGMGGRDRRCTSSRGRGIMRSSYLTLPAQNPPTRPPPPPPLTFHQVPRPWSDLLP